MRTPNMRLVSLLLIVSLILNFNLRGKSQNIVDLEYNQQISELFVNLGLISAGFDSRAKNGIDRYDITYTMTNHKNELDTVSGIFLVPVSNTNTKKYDLVISMHGTVESKVNAPSTSNFGTDLAYFYASQGYMVIAPDYVGLGKNDARIHPYLHVESQANSGIEMFNAIKQVPLFANQYNNSIYLSGYSQGGHASMSLQKMATEQNILPEIKAAAHMSGPYSISSVFISNLLLQDIIYPRPSYLVFVIAAMQEVYGNLYTDVEDAFDTPYAGNIKNFIDGFSTSEVTLKVLNDQLGDSLTRIHGDLYVNNLFKPSYLQSIRTDTTHPLRIALQLNDAFKSSIPFEEPTRLFYCEKDEVISSSNSINAANYLNNLGSIDLKAINVVSDKTHTGCITPAVEASLKFFKSVFTSSIDNKTTTNHWTFNQRKGAITINTFDEISRTVELFDAFGRSIKRINQYISGNDILVPSTISNFVVVRLLDKDGNVYSKKLLLH